MTFDLNVLLQVLQLGPAAALIMGGIMEWYVWGPTYRREVAEKETWKEVALRSLNVAEKKL